MPGHWSVTRTHSLGLTLGLLELFAIKRFRWKRGVAWGFVVQARKSLLLHVSCCD